MPDKTVPVNLTVLSSVHAPVQKELSRSLSRSPVPGHTSEEESRQMEEIQRLEREIERLQRQQEDGVSLLGDDGRDHLRQHRDAEIYRLEKEASRVATEFLDLLDFGGLEPSLSSEENLHDPAETPAPLAEEEGEEEEGEEEEEEADEGFHADDECVPLPDLPLPASPPLDQEVFQSVPPPPPGFAEGPVAPPPSSDPSAVYSTSSSSSSAPAPRGSWHSTVVTQQRDRGPTPPPPVLPNGGRQPYVSMGLTAEAEPPGREPPTRGPPQDAESDYDQDEYEEVHGSSGASTNDGHGTDEEVLRGSSCTQNSLDSFKGSSDSVRTTETQTH